MKIAFVYDVPYPWHVGGIESMNYNEAEELAKEHEVHFFTTKWKGMKSSDFMYNGIHYHAMHQTDQSRIYRHGRRSIREAIAYAASVRKLSAYDFDVVITNAFPMLHLPIVKRYCRQKGAKLIMEVAEVWDREYWRRYLGPVSGDIAYAYSRRAIRGADFYVAISSATTAKLAGFGIKGRNVSIFAPNLDDEALERVVRRGMRSKLVMFSGRMIKEKRLDKWLSAFKIAYERDHSLRGLIVGSGPERRFVEESVSELGLRGKVAIRDFYSSSKELYETIKQSALVLHMSEREGLGIIAIESIALGTPVLLPSYTPIPKEVKDMCVVENEADIPAKIAEIACSKDPSKYIRNKKNLYLYSKSKVAVFYGQLFSRLGVGRRTSKTL